MKRLLISALILIPLISIALWFTMVEKLDDNNSQKITIYKDVELWNCYDDLKEYEPLVITDQDQVKTIKEHLNKVRYVETFTKYEFCKNDYLIEFEDGKGVRVTKSNGKYYLGSSDKVIFGKFEFLDELKFEEKSE